jgi:hypothetical protein
MKRDEPLKIIFRELRATNDKAKQRDIVRRLQIFWERSLAFRHAVDNQKNVVKWHAATQRAGKVAEWLTEVRYVYAFIHPLYYPDEPPISETIERLRKIVEMASNNPPGRRRKGNPTKLNFYTDLVVRLVERMYLDANPRKKKAGNGRHYNPHNEHDPKNGQLLDFPRLVQAVFAYFDDPRGDDAVIRAINHSREHGDY